MDSEEKDLLEKTFELEKENNKMLHRIRGVQRRQALWTVFKFLLIFGIAIGAFYYIEPYLEKVAEIFNKISGIEQGIDTSSLKEMLKNIGS